MPTSSQIRETIPRFTNTVPVLWCRSLLHGSMRHFLVVFLHQLRFGWYSLDFALSLTSLTVGALSNWHGL